MNDVEIPALYHVALETCYAFGLPWTDPRTGFTYMPRRRRLKSVESFADARALFDTFTTRELHYYRAALALDRDRALRDLHGEADGLVGRITPRFARATIEFCDNRIRLIDDVLAKRRAAK